MKKSYLFAFISCFFWATLAPVSKLLFHDMTNMAVLGYGSFIGASVLFIVLLIKGELKKLREYSAKDIFSLLALGAMGYFLYSVFYYKGISVLPAQTACILNYLWPVMTVVFSVPILKEQISTPKILALVLSFAGVCVIVLSDSSGAKAGKESIPGYICCVLAAVCYGLFNCLNKKRKGNQLIHMMLYIGIGAVLAMFCHMAEGMQLPTGQQWLGLLWLGIFADAIAYLFWALALSGGNTVLISNIAFVTPVLSIFLCAILLDEPLYMTSFIGLAFILGGIILQSVLDNGCIKKN